MQNIIIILGKSKTLFATVLQTNGLHRSNASNLRRMIQFNNHIRTINNI